MNYRPSDRRPNHELGVWPQARDRWRAMDAGVDTLWPLERASDVDPLEVRKRFGKSLRLWGGVDKRVLALGPQAIRAHLCEMIPLIEEGGFIPTVDHTVPPDISWDNFRYYMEAKMALLSGEFGKLE